MGKQLLLVGLLIATSNLSAQSLLTDFVKCNSNFFATLYIKQKELEQSVDISKIDDKYAYIKVPNRLDKQGKYIMFKQPINEQGLTLNGYKDEVLQLGSFGSYYTWGFLIEQPVTTVIKQFSQIKWQDNKQGGYFANNKIIPKKAKLIWQDDPNQQLGTIPKVGTVEKVLLVEPWQGKTLLTCSVQGSVTKQILAIDRPDL